MLSSIVAVSTNHNHMLHPFNLDFGFENQIPTWKKVLSISVFIILGVGTCGIASVFFAFTAYNKLQKIKSKPIIEISEHLNSTESYSLEQAIIKIRNFAKEEKKLCLFLGRSDEEVVPQEDDAVWISLDISVSAKPSPNRLHLQMDFNDSTEMAKIKGLFDKVIVDQSTFKFIRDKPWKRLSELLKPSIESLLITEAHPGSICYFDHNNPKQAELANKSSYEDGGVILPIKAAMDEKFAQKCEDERLIKVTNYLKTIFKKVTLEQNKPYPYPTKWCDGQSSFFVLNGPI